MTPIRADTMIMTSLALKAWGSLNMFFMFLSVSSRNEYHQLAPTWRAWESVMGVTSEETNLWLFLSSDSW